MSSARARSCTSKKAYATRAAAIFFAGADGLRPYRCAYCGKFHLSSAMTVDELERRGKEKAGR